MNRYWQTAHEVDRRQAKGAVPYCIIKSYSGLTSFNGGNIDVVVDIPLQVTFDRLYADSFRVTRRDWIKALFYEKNKLMLTPVAGEFTKIHLHSNAGWHNTCFVDAPTVFAARETHPVCGRPVNLLSRDLEARICLLHVLFEKMAKSPDDATFLREEDYLDFTREFRLPDRLAQELARASGEIPFRILYPLWRAYYGERMDINSWNLFLHFVLVAVQLKRRRRWQPR